MDTSLFPLQSYWWFYAGFVAFIVVLLVLDLKVFHRRTHALTSKEAGIWTAFWASLAVAFNVALYFAVPRLLATDPRFAAWTPQQCSDAGARIAKEFLNGYLVEISLSVDNLFVFVVIFTYFRISGALQHRILFFGILGAIICRAIFVGAASILMRFELVVVVMGLFLIYTGYKVIRGDDGEIEPEKSPLLRIFRRFYPVTARTDGDRFFVIENGRKAATPLFVTLIVVEMTDIVFALDSVPAVFGFTREPLVVFTSNMFAILGLRTLYFLLLNAYGKFHLLKYGLGIILVFVGAKMSVLHWFNVDVHVDLALGFVLGVLALSITASLLVKPKPAAKSTPAAPPP